MNTWESLPLPFSYDIFNILNHFKEGKLTVKAKLGVLATLVDG